MGMLSNLKYCNCLDNDIRDMFLLKQSCCCMFRHFVFQQEDVVTGESNKLVKQSARCVNTVRFCLDRYRGKLTCAI